MRRYTLRQLDTFLEVSRDLSVSSAAARLHITQPAVSMQLRQLEEAVGLQLFEHVGRRLQLTDAGEDLRTYANAAAAELRGLDDAMAMRKGVHRGRVNIAVVSTAKYFVPMLLAHFRRKFPGITLKLDVHNRETILQSLGRNEVDLVVMGRAPDELSCIALPFARNPLSVVSAPEHPMSRRKRASLSLLRNEPWVVRERGSGTRQAMERLFAKHRLTPHIAMEMPSNETIKQAVMAGMGLSFLSERTIRHEVAAGRIVVLDIAGLPVMRDWYVTHLTEKHLSPAADALKRFLIEEGGPLVDAWA